MTTLASGLETGRRPAPEPDEPGDRHQEAPRQVVAGPDAIDEMIEIHGGRLHVRADRTAWIDVADARAARDGHPVGFATRELVGYVTLADGGVVAVVGVCSRRGCLLQPSASTQSLGCPSAGATFRPDGRVLDPGGH